MIVLQYVLPTDSPHLAKSAFAIALSPMLWAQHKPDRFDSWSAGIVLLQLALPGLRQPRGLNLFKSEYERTDYDIFQWKENCRWISKRDTAVLDANDGAGGSGCTKLDKLVVTNKPDTFVEQDEGVNAVLVLGICKSSPHYCLHPHSSAFLAAAAVALCRWHNNIHLRVT